MGPIPQVAWAREFLSGRSHRSQSDHCAFHALVVLARIAERARLRFLG